MPGLGVISTPGWSRVVGALAPNVYAVETGSVEVMSSGPLAPNVAHHADESDEVTTLDAGPGVISTLGWIRVVGALAPNVYAVETESVEVMSSGPLAPNVALHTDESDEVTTLDAGPAVMSTPGTIHVVEALDPLFIRSGRGPSSL